MVYVFCFLIETFTSAIIKYKIYFLMRRDKDLCALPFIEQTANTKVVGSV